MAKVYIDPGHGGHDSGATGNGLKEKDLTLKIGKHTRDYLQDNYKGVSVKMSRTGDTYPSLTDRTNDANNWGADVFVSPHINAGGGVGYEDYIYNGSVSSKTKDLQNKIHNEVAPLFSNDRGKKRANLAVVRQTSMPAVLTESGFIDSKKDADFLKKDSNLKKLGEAHAKGIAVFLGLAKGSSNKSSGGSKKSSSSYTGDSVVDYLKSIGQDSSYSNRAKLAKEYGISGYKGTTSQNSQLLNKLRGGTQSTKTSKKYPLPDGVLKSGSRGNSVKQVQRALNAANFKVGKADGIYGAKTKDAVTRFQKVHDAYNVDGIYGPRTKTRLDKVVN